MISLTKISQIAKLPWTGNHNDDQVLFEVCQKFINESLKGNSRVMRERRKRAYSLVFRYGMGIKENVTDGELELIERA